MTNYSKNRDWTLIANKRYKILISWDDYHEKNYQIAALLKKYELPATFFIEAGGQHKKNQIINLANMGFEIGCHTWSHPQDLKELTDDQLEWEIKVCRENLQEWTGQKIDWFCYPRGRYNERVINHVKGAGYLSARTTDIIFNKPPDENAQLWQPGGIHCFQREEYRTDWLDFGKFYIDTAIKDNMPIRIWGHAKEIEKNNEWGKLEKLFEYLYENLSRQ